ncbi:MAG TPA: TIGR00730 family Rossman fold protein [Bacteroidales bacterium]|nr:TIGR00730 family Rossman fold protein [Bacteroidales bacterium]HCB60619.1 TIGR00730 family Rossman fold protein [Bacteroidales bacterium]HCY22988.1 TIGR00730 family Rossman fold protein [Bacteroidales bacterium]
MNEKKDIKSVAIFCGSSVGADKRYSEATEELVRVLHAHGISIIYGAGCTGLMGVVAEEALRLKMHITGVVPSFFMSENVVHNGLSELIVTDSMATRKNVILEKSDACIALPGGFGTFDELFEVATAVQLGLQMKPIGLLNTKNYYDPLLAMMQNAVREKFVREDHLKAIVSDVDAEKLFEKLINIDYQAPANWIEKLIERNSF